MNGGSAHPFHIYELGMHFDAASGGADRYFNGLVDGLREINASCTALAFGTPVESPENITLGTSGSSLYRRLRTIRNACRNPLRDDKGIIATHFALYATALQPTLSHCNHVVHFHGPWATESHREGQSKITVIAKRLLERSVYRSAKRLIVLSSAFRDILATEYDIPSDRIRIVPGGVETRRFRPANRREMRRLLEWPEHPTTIFCVRRLVQRMGLGNLIAAFASLNRSDTRLVIAGRGPLENELRAQAAASGVGERIHFTGFVPDEDLPKMYAAADFSIVPSETLEGFGLTTLESMASGTPVLVTPVGGLPETVAALDHSLILSGNDEPAIREGLKRGLDQELPSSARCREYIESSFAWPAIARRVLEVYSEVAP